MALSSTEERIENWARWVRIYPQFLRLEQCDSIEGNWRSPQFNHWADDAPPPSKRPRPDAADAWDVALAVATLARKYHLVLKLCHVVRFAGRRLDDRMIARELRKRLREKITPSDVFAVESMAKVMLTEALGTPVRRRQERAVTVARMAIGPRELALTD